MCCIPSATFGVSLIIDNGNQGTDSTGQWSQATAASVHYGANSLYATVGGSVDTYRFTPNITVQGQYDVYVWNSCFSNRHTAVPHRIVHADGETIVNVDQDCDSGSSGEWLLLGRYTFNVGTQGYLEISDQGLTWPSTTYIGADAVRFEEYDETTPSGDTESPEMSKFVDNFNTADCSEVESLGSNYTINNESSLPVVGKRCGRYYAELTDNSNNKTLHYHNDQGRLDGLLVSFPFECIVRDIGIGTLDDPLTAPQPTDNYNYIFAGVQVHVVDLDDRNSSHVVVGHRGENQYTIEGKNTLNGTSSVNDIGANMVPDGRADIRIVGNEDRTLTVYWQTPNHNVDSTADGWNLYRGTGNLPGIAPSYGEQVYIGLITYAFYSKGVPFVGTANSIEVIGDVTLESVPVDVSIMEPSLSVTPQVDGQFLISFSYIRPANSDDSLYTIQKSSDLDSWEVADESNGTITLNDNGDGTETIFWNSSSNSPLFIRVSVSNP